MEFSGIKVKNFYNVVIGFTVCWIILGENFVDGKYRFVW